MRLLPPGLPPLGHHRVIVEAGVGRKVVGLRGGGDGGAVQTCLVSQADRPQRSLRHRHRHKSQGGRCQRTACRRQGLAGSAGHTLGTGWVGWGPGAVVPPPGPALGLAAASWQYAYLDVVHVDRGRHACRRGSGGEKPWNRGFWLLAAGRGTPSQPWAGAGSRLAAGSRPPARKFAGTCRRRTHLRSLGEE